MCESKKSHAIREGGADGAEGQVADALKEAGYTVTDAVFIWKPKAPVEVTEEEEEMNLVRPCHIMLVSSWCRVLVLTHGVWGGQEAIDMLEELDDVDAVFTNMA